MGVGDLHTKTTWNKSLRDLDNEMRLWGIADYIPPNLKAATDDQKVLVRFFHNGQWSPIECSIGPTRYARYNPATSLRAIVLAIAAVRKMDQRGIGSVIAQVAVHLALPDPTDPYAVLGVTRSSTKEEIRSAYVQKAKANHPDTGGREADFRRINDAARELGVA